MHTLKSVYCEHFVLIVSNFPAKYIWNEEHVYQIFVQRKY